MKFITNFFRKLFRKTENTVENVDIKIQLWNPPKNVEIYQEIREDHEKTPEMIEPKKRKPAKPRAPKAKDTVTEEKPKRTTRKKKSE